MPIEHINPPGLSTPAGYTHVVTATGGKVVFVSGQVSGEGDLATQARQVYENLRIALAAAGATFADVVKQTTYVVGFKPEDRAVIGEVRRQYLPADRPPASTLVGVQALAAPQYLIEVEAIAVVG